MSAITLKQWLLDTGMNKTEAAKFFGLTRGHFSVLSNKVECLVYKDKLYTPTKSLVK